MNREIGSLWNTLEQDEKQVPIREMSQRDVSLLEVSSFQRVVCTDFNGVGT